MNASFLFDLVTIATWDVRSELTMAQLRSSITITTMNNTIMTASMNDYLIYAGRGVGSLLHDDVWIASSSSLSSGSMSWIMLNSTTRYSMSPGSTQCTSSRSNLIVMISGHGPGSYYEISSDGGMSWQRIDNQLFNARAYSTCLFDEHDGLLLIGGWLYEEDYDTVVNDIWHKPDIATSSSPFIRVTSSAAWSARDGHMITSYYSSHLNRSLIYLIGGRQQNHRWSSGDVTGSNDIWISSDQAVSFILLTLHAPFSARSHGRLSASSDGVLVLTGGESNQFSSTNVIYRDVWISLDGGYTWNECASNDRSTSYTARRLHASLIDHQDYLWLAAGENGSGKFNDVWRSRLRLNEHDEIVRECALERVPCGAGLRCWPTTDNTTCLCTPSSSSSSSSTAVSSSSSMFISSSSLSSTSSPFLPIEVEDTSSSSSSTQLSGGVIAGIVIACIVGLLLCWLVLVSCYTRRRQRMSSPTSISRSPSSSALQIVTLPVHAAFSHSELDTPSLHPQASSSTLGSSRSTWSSSTSSVSGRQNE